MPESTTHGVERRDIVVRRVFDAPVELVWKAWTDPQEVTRWWGPTGFTSPIARMDSREGGTSLVSMRSPDGQDFYSTWTYRKIVTMQRIEYIHNLADRDGKKVDPVQLGLPPDFPEDTLTVVTFRALGDDKTEMTITEYAVAPAGSQMLENAEVGLNQSIDKMAATFAEPQARSAV